MKFPLGPIGYHLLSTFAKVRNKLGTWLLSGAFAEAGSHSTIAFPVRINGPRGIHLGSGCYVGQGSWIGTVPNEPGADENPVLKIGDRVRMSGHVVISAAKRVELQEGVLLARNVYISDHSHVFVRPEVPIHQQGVDQVDPVLIEKNVWIGQNAVICPGVTIGEGSVIGANTLVKNDIPPRSVAVGTPARVIRTLDSERDRQEAIQSTA